MRGILASSKLVAGLQFTLVAVVLLAFSRPVLAQTLYGSLVGTVTDSSGLAVPGATVTITHAETSQSREATTNATGSHSPPTPGGPSR